MENNFNPRGEAMPRLNWGLAILDEGAIVDRDFQGVRFLGC
ncbi:hypothetical protein CKA32_006247 [Geitlerinema sp. FC II]|nr:hypothetical protein CKA32_006247 [Geitlerinema sp. FC II]